MSNKDDDFGFDDGLFRDFDEEGEGAGGFGAGEEPGEFGGFDDFEDTSDFDQGFDFGADEEPLFEEEFGEPSEEGGPSRNFVIIAIALVLLLLLGVGLVAFLALRPTGPTEIDITRTAIAFINATTEAQAAQIETQAAENAFATETAMAFTETPTPTPTPTETSTPSEAEMTAIFLTEQFAQVGAEGLTATVQQATAEARQTQLAQLEPTDTPSVVEATEEATEEATPLEAVTEEPVGASPTATIAISDIQLTSTAIFLLFQATPTQEDITGIGGAETQIPGTPIPGATPRPTAIPDTGLFDDVVAGGPALMFLMAFGLAGLIFLSRGIRAANRKK